MKEPKVLTRMRLCECWGDSLGIEELKEVNNYIGNLQRENQELKKQLENCYCNRTDCSSRIKDSKQYDSLVQTVESQQKEFIKYLENEIYNLNDFMKNIETSDKCHGDYPITYYMAQYKLQKSKEILSKYKEIIGEKDE